MTSTALLLSLVATAAVSFAAPIATTQLAASSPFNDTELAAFTVNFLANIGTQCPGCVIASPSKSSPDYFYHWVRDGAISMNVLLTAQGPLAKDSMMAYVEWVRRAQAQADPNGQDTLGEPKFYVDGKVYDKPWGRPQNDGPALRAIVLTNFANSISNTTYIREKLYSADMTGYGIKRDLEYVSHHWQDKSFDLWEEVKAQHFFTLMVQRKALIVGAALAEKLADSGAATFYRAQAVAIEGLIKTFWDGGVIRTSLNCEAGCETLQGKQNNLDSAQHLGALYGAIDGDDFFSPTSDEVLATVEKLQQTMQNAYHINQVDTSNGLAGFSVGRYYPDRYTGTGADPNFTGQPWFLTSASMAEIYYRAAAKVQREGMKISDVTRAFYTRVGVEADDEDAQGVAAKLQSYGDGILKRLRHHIGCDAGYYHVSEQFDGEYGMQRGARDLTWSYGTLISAIGARAAISGRNSVAQVGVAMPKKCFKKNDNCGPHAYCMIDPTKQPPYYCHKN